MHTFLMSLSFPRLHKPKSLHRFISTKPKQITYHTHVCNFDANTDAFVHGTLVRFGWFGCEYLHNSWWSLLEYKLSVCRSLRVRITTIQISQVYGYTSDDIHILFYYLYSPSAFWLIEYRNNSYNTTNALIQGKIHIYD